jgi:polyphosphate kinase
LEKEDLLLSGKPASIAMPYFNRDLSLLSFNRRVLMEADDESVPLYERIRFLAIFSSNMDEFFRVRMPEILTLSGLRNKDHQNSLADFPDNRAAQIQQIVSATFKDYGRILQTEILPLLNENKIHLYYQEPIQPVHKPLVREYFFSRVLSFLQPFWMDEKKEAVFLVNNALYLMVSLYPEGGGDERFAVVNIPSGNLSRFLELPSTGDIHQLIFLDDVIRENLQEVFPGYRINETYGIKMTRDAELNLVDELSGDIALKIEASLPNRELGLPTRFLYEDGMPAHTCEFLARYFELASEEMIRGGRYHNLKDLSDLPNPGGSKFDYPPRPPLRVASFNPAISILENVLRNDHLVHLPYHSYDPVLRFFNEAAIHPDVQEIYITLYRVAANSHIANAMISAAKNGKRVTVFVELKARFDEANNLGWSKKLKAAGVKIVNSIPNLKVHAKIALVKRKSGRKWEYFGLMSTGNFNEVTSRFYTDEVFFTSDGQITRELELLFAYLRNREQPFEYPFVKFKELLVTQFNLVSRFEQMINREIELVNRGKRGYIIIKLNNLQEEGMIKKLYQASLAGVEISLIIRGICCLVPAQKGWSENIRILRIVDRYLEHSRVFYFHNDGDAEVYLGSADWMNRNLHRRIEVCFPVKDQELKEQLIRILEIQLSDNTKAEELKAGVDYVRIIPLEGEPLVNAQEKIYEYVRVEGE